MTPGPSLFWYQGGKCDKISIVRVGRGRACGGALEEHPELAAAPQDENCHLAHLLVAINKDIVW
jgi:hypothetical protein